MSSLKTQNSRLRRNFGWQAKLKTIFYILFIIAAGVHLLSAADASPSASKERLKIGVIGPETGEDAETGIMTLTGVELAKDVINNAGGIDGRKIDLIHYDNKSNPKITQTAVYKMIKEGVIAIIASPGGWSTFAPVWIANESKIIFMSAGSKRHIGRSGQFIFRNALADETATEEAIRYVVRKSGYKNYTIVTSMRDDETSLTIGGLYRRAVMNNGGRITSETHLFMGATTEEAISQLKKDAKGQVDAVIFAGDDAVAVDILKELRKQGIKAPMIGGDILYTDDFLKNGGELTAGTLIYSGFFSEAKSPAVEKFVSNYRKKTGKKPGTFAAVSYDSLMLIAEAVKTAKSIEPSKVRDALSRIKDFDGVTGRTSMGRYGETAKKPFLLQVTKEGGRAAFRHVE